ncbi:hypothetical protein BK004_00225 [bacterium CG10_46_32]|nr:MAG: hypothetical protein BK004_00225 [bacterium CG10_46_32]PIR56549.1 MAG: hypothetical protein COU73_00225 [Parcubacteria group bacterium CG10_big_fil_rev_8_21_14_0_10_46_32]
MQNKNYIGSIIVWTLALVPVVLWFAAPLGSGRFSATSIALTSLGQLTALVGTCLFALNLVLSARLKFVANLFKSLNIMYLRHANFGKYAVVLLLFHPLLLLGTYSGGSLGSAVQFLLPSRDWPTNFGFLSLALLVVLVVLTLYLRPKYHIWKWTHKCMGLAFFLGALHAWLIPSTMGTYLPLRYYVLGLSFLGLTAYVYHTILGRFLVPHTTYMVSNVEVLNNRATHVTMKPAGKAIRFEPGQFMFVSFDDANVGSESHPFSITAGPNEDLSITAKKLGDYTEKLPELKVGARVRVEGPFGAFSHTRAEHSRQVWIAGGIGITPFVSMAKALARDPKYRVMLYYAVHNKQEAVYYDELKKLADSSGGALALELFCSDEQGKIDASYISAKNSDLKNADVFLCAPPSMIHALKAQFLALGIPQSQLHSEEFSL